MIQVFLLLLLGAATGVLSGFLGIGGGVVLVPGLAVLLGMPFRQAAAISLMVVVPTALIGIYRHAQHGALDWRTAALLAVPAMFGSSLGVRIGLLFSNHGARRAFAIFLILLGLDLLLGGTEWLKQSFGSGPKSAVAARQLDRQSKVNGSSEVK